jgi:hypothetical protein
MPTAFVKYRSGGGYQAVENYDYVLDTRNLVESGFYRDSGFNPTVVPTESAVINSEDLDGLSFGSGSFYQVNSGTLASCSNFITGTLPNLYAKQPDEVTHTAPRQLSYYETTLSFFGNSDVFADFAGTDSGGNLRITVADVSLFAGRPVTLNSNALPDNIYPNEIYYPVPLSSTTMLLQTTLGGSIVPFSSTGSGVITVLDVLGQFQWANILGWSNTAPTR